MVKNLRSFGWLLLVMGIVIGGLTALSMLGLVKVAIFAFGHQLDSLKEHRIFLAVWIGAAVIGIALLRSARRAAAIKAIPERRY